MQQLILLAAPFAGKEEIELKCFKVNYLRGSLIKAMSGLISSANMRFLISASTWLRMFH
jgi:hypothetical protein